MPTITEMKDQLEALRVQATAITDRAVVEEREFTAEERQQLVGLVNEGAGIKKKIKESASDDDLKNQIASLGDIGIDLQGGTTSHRPRIEPVQARFVPGKTIGEQFIESKPFQNWLQGLKVGEKVPDSSRIGNSPPMLYNELLPRYINGREVPRFSNDLLTGTSSSSGGAFVLSDEQPYVALGRRPLVMRGVVTNDTTTSDTVEFVRTLVETNNAAPVAEATATSGGSGVKPESAMTFERVTETVKTLAHWIPATKRALSDVRQLRTLIDNFLRDGLEQELEDQMVTGDGVGQNFTGIANTSGTQSQAWDTDIFVTTRRARRKVRTVGRAIPNAYLLNPEDWETIELSTDDNNRFYGDGPFGVMQPRLWGLPVVESEAVPQGNGYVADFRQCVLWDREETTISMSDSHSDFFVRNLIAVLAEMRAAFGVLRPAAIVEIDLTA